MKKIILMAMIAMTAGLASATLVAEDWNAYANNDRPFTIAHPVVNPTAGAWYGIGEDYVNGQAMAMVRIADSGGLTGLMYVLDGTTLTSGQEYSVSFDITEVSWTGNEHVGLDIWDVEYNTGTVSAGLAYWAQWNGGDLPDLVTTGDASATELAESQWHAPTYLNQNVGLNFTYDGTGDIQLRFAESSDGSTGWHHIKIDNFEVAAVPQPATLGLFAIFGTGILFSRKRRMV